ncbi:MAG: tetratricopeptide repeat protein, partial [Archangium sp.]|nr:tetratricopeptide repeat protein [Archangium sp.]
MPAPQRAFDAQRARISKLVRDGQGSAAWAELQHAAKHMALSGPVVTTLGRAAVVAKRVGAMLTWLEPRLDGLDGETRLAVLRALARTRRKAGDVDGARATLERALAEWPDDRRARAVLNALLARDERWSELDRSLEREVKDALRRGAFATASRAALRRARVWGERLHNPARAALRYAQAAEYAERAGTVERAFLLRLLEVRNLYVSRASTRAIGLAGSVVTRLGERLGALERTKAVLKELHGAHGDTASRRVTDPDVPVFDTESPERAATVEAMPAVTSPQAQDALFAVASAVDGATRSPEVAAVLAAAVDEAPSSAAMQRLETHCRSRGAWAELALAYRDAWTRSENVREQQLWATKLADLLDTQLHDHVGAAEIRAQLAALSSDATHTTHIPDDENAEGTSEERAQHYVERAGASLVEGAYAAARADFKRALTVLPSWLPAHAGLAELAAVQGDVAPARAFEKVARAAPVGPQRSEAMRRLGRLADGALRDATLSSEAWRGVLESQPDDEEASRRLRALARETNDWATLEALVRAQLERTPSVDELRLELVAVLEATSRADEALAELRELVRRAPSNAAAWLMLADRLIQRRTLDEAVWVLEFAATATVEPLQKMLVYRRLARLVREGLGDEERAAVFAQRAEALQADLLVEVPGAPSGGDAMPFDPVAPEAEALRDQDFDDIAEALEARFEMEDTIGDDG